MNQYKSQKLRMYKMALQYIDSIYELSDSFPAEEKYNLRSQIIRAATSIALNIAEGSTGLSNKEQSRFLGLAIRSLLETVACIDLIERRRYYSEEALIFIKEFGRTLYIKLSNFRQALK